VQRRAAEEVTKSSFDQAGAAIASTTGTTVPKRQLEELMARAAMDFDGFYETRSVDSVRQAGKTGPILALSTDGKGIVMRPESLREATRKAAAKRDHKMSKRLSRGEKRNCTSTLTGFDPGVLAETDPPLKAGKAAVRDLLVGLVDPEAPKESAGVGPGQRPAKRLRRSEEELRSPRKDRGREKHCARRGEGKVTLTSLLLRRWTAEWPPSSASGQNASGLGAAAAMTFNWVATAPPACAPLGAR
jgi:hypothetical protein